MIDLEQTETDLLAWLCNHSAEVMAEVWAAFEAAAGPARAFLHDEVESRKDYGGTEQALAVLPREHRRHRAFRAALLDAARRMGEAKARAIEEAYLAPHPGAVLVYVQNWGPTLTCTGARTGDPSGPTVWLNQKGGVVRVSAGEASRTAASA